MSALVISWNSAHVVSPMISSLLASRGSLVVELVHVDNGSTDDSVDLVRRQWDGPINQRVNDGNVGFARALKQAVEHANGEFLLLLNPDARLDPGALGVLVGDMNNDPELGAVGPLIHAPDGSIELFCARRSPHLFDALVQAIGVGPFLAGTRLDTATFPRRTYNREHEVPCLSGAAMLVRASALVAAGGVDDRVFMYFEDLDVCERLRRDGWHILFCPAARVTHISGSSSVRDADLQIWLETQVDVAINTFLLKHRGLLVATIHRVVLALGGLTRWLAYSIAPGWKRLPASGPARLRWALTGRLPPGDPRAESS